MIIGKFQQDNGVYIGNVPSMTGPGIPVRIAPTDLKGIDYVVTLSGTDAELGIGWKRTSAKGNAFVSVKLDAPSLPAPDYCALVKQSDGSYALLWDRPKPKAEDEQPAADEVTG